MQVDWIDILKECKNRVQKNIKPLLAEQMQPLPSLGLGAGGDRLEPIDLAAERAIVDTFRDHEISFTLVSEESGIKKYGEKTGECYVTTDPVDGSTNLSRRIPFYACSVAVSTQPVLTKVHSALVADLFHDVTYTAQKSFGAFRNGKRISPSNNTIIEEAVIGLDLNSFKVKELLPSLARVVEQTKHIRHFGANALELCYVADGKTDSFIDIRGKLRTTDIAAAWLIVNEAGALMTTPEGEPLKARLDPKQRVKFVASGNPAIHAEFLDLIGRKG
jgi:myo-inositol-1(or 4)-monophosphatase